jgi:hypothetical protein
LDDFQTMKKPDSAGFAVLTVADYSARRERRSRRIRCTMATRQRQDKHRHSTHDMPIFFPRKPVEDGHVSFAYDSFKPHIEIPLSIDRVARAS